MDPFPGMPPDRARERRIREDLRYPPAYLRGARLLRVIKTVAGIMVLLTTLVVLLFLNFLRGLSPSFSKAPYEGLALLLGMLLVVLISFWAGVAYAHKRWMQVRRAGWRFAIVLSIFLIVTGITPFSLIYLGEILSLFLDVPRCSSDGGPRFLCHRAGYSLHQLLDWSVLVPLCVVWVAFWVAGFLLLSSSMDDDVRDTFAIGHRFDPVPESPSIQGAYPEDGALTEWKR